MTSPGKVVLAYSGGLDTSVIIPWLKEQYGSKVIAVIVDVGQPEDFAAVRQKALASGADGAEVVDAKDEFVSEYCFPALRANAVYEGQYLLGTALARPVIAKAQVEVALAESADAVAHGCTGKGNDQVRFELAYRALAPHLRIIAPWREWTLHSRDDEIEYAAAHGIPVPATREKPYSVDQNIWHRSAEAGILEDPWQEPPEHVYGVTTAPGLAPDEPAYVEIAFERGTPAAVDGRQMSAVDILASLNRVGAAHGVGRTDMVENRLVGIKSRGVYETPGGTILAAAHRDLETITLDRETQHYGMLIAPRYAELVYYGQWFTPLRQAFDGFVTSAQAAVNGTVRLRLFKGACVPVARRSPNSLYREDLATFGQDAVYNQKDAEGFINLWALPGQVFAATNPGMIRRGMREPVK
jgi:argininosuccinate synthase